ncbi:MAG: alpha/beta hydrolase, partial [Anaerolineae bacterium]|nr:alpha/beta hydrolase [Anaerolineae bacterium]
MPYLEHNHHRIHYRERGEGPLMVILPGNTATSACHEGEIAYFSGRYRVVAPDFWGTGRSDRLATWPDDWMEQAAHDTAALIRTLGDKAVVMGTSGGADVALWLATLHPGCVSAVIADSTLEVYPPDLLRAGMHEREARTPGQVAFWKMAQGDDWEAVVDADTCLMLRIAGRGGRLAPENLTAITAPVLFTATLDDTMLPQVAQQLTSMTQRIPDARLYLTKGGGHPLMWSKPDEFREVCDVFLQ